jgi:hypothetical protein
VSLVDALQSSDIPDEERDRGVNLVDALQSSDIPDGENCLALNLLLQFQFMKLQHDQ